MKVTFVSPYYQNVWEPLGLAYIIGYCQKEIFDLRVAFCHGNFDDNAAILDQCLKSDVVAIGATSPTYAEATRLAKAIKAIKPEIQTVLGGWHSTALQHTEHFHFFDHSICGEGEQAMSLILQGVKDLDSWMNLKPLEFNELTWPDRAMIKQERHLDLCYKMCGQRIASFQSRRGCPMNCTFCAESCMTGGTKVRVRDPEDVLDEIDAVYTDYKIDMFKFVDPTWVAPISAAYDFCHAKIERKNHLPWEAMGHAAFLTKDLLMYMKEANCNQINIGVESGCPDLLIDMKKGVTLKKIRKVFRWCHDVGIESRAFFLLGMPNETLKTAKQTFNFAKKINPDVFGITILCPYPGTDFYDIKKHGHIDWAKADEYGNDFWETENLTNADLKRIQGVFAKAFKDKIPPHMKEIMEAR